MEDKNVSPDILKTIQLEMDSDVHPILKKILDNIKAIGVALGGVIVAVGIYSGVTSYQESQHAKAVSQLGNILVTADLATRAQKLEAFLQSGPTSLNMAVRLELAKLYTETGAHDKALTMWQAIGQNADMSTIAGLGQAHSLMAQGNFAKAVEMLTSLKGSAGEAYSLMVSTTLAFAAEQAGRTDVALAEYEALKAKDSGNESFLNYKIGMLKAKS